MRGHQSCSLTVLTNTENSSRVEDNYGVSHALSHMHLWKYVHRHKENNLFSENNGREFDFQHARGLGTAEESHSCTYSESLTNQKCYLLTQTQPEAEEALLTSETNSIHSPSNHNTIAGDSSKSKHRRCLFSAPLLFPVCVYFFLFY